MKKHRHPNACHCARCAAVAAGKTPEQVDADMAKRERAHLETIGWYAHLVVDDSDSPTGFNWHTHGLQERFGHRDLQIVVPMPPERVHHIGATLAGRVKAGEKFGSGQKVADVIQGAKHLEGQELLVKLIEARECGRPVLRIILPDPQGKLDLGEIDETFARQYADLEEAAGRGPQAV